MYLPLSIVFNIVVCLLPFAQVNFNLIKQGVTPKCYFSLGELQFTSKGWYFARKRSTFLCQLASKFAIQHIVSAIGRTTLS